MKFIYTLDKQLFINPNPNHQSATELSQQIEDLSDEFETHSRDQILNTTSHIIKQLDLSKLPSYTEIYKLGKKYPNVKAGERTRITRYINRQKLVRKLYNEAKDKLTQLTNNAPDPKPAVGLIHIVLFYIVQEYCVQQNWVDEMMGLENYLSKDQIVPGLKHWQQEINRCDPHILDRVIPTNYYHARYLGTDIDYDEKIKQQKTAFIEQHSDWRLMQNTTLINNNYY